MNLFFVLYECTVEDRTALSALISIFLIQIPHWDIKCLLSSVPGVLKRVHPSLGHAHGLEEGQRVLTLLFLSLVAPLELVLHHVKNSRQGKLRSLTVEKR